MINNFIDSLFEPVLAFLDQIKSKEAQVGTVAAKGIRLDDYFGFFGIIGPAWTGVIMSFLASFVFIFILYLIQKNGRMLLTFKDFIKWW